jgi:hypothetical protein
MNVIFHARVIRNRDDSIQALARPLFCEHLFPCNENDACACALALAQKVITFEIARKAQDCQLALPLDTRCF